MRIRRHILFGMWRAVAPLVAVGLVLGPLLWVLDRRAVMRQNQQVVAVAQAVWMQIEEGAVLPVFGAAGALPASRRATPIRTATCREAALPGGAPGIVPMAVLCLTEDGRARRYLAVGLSWREAAPVAAWADKVLDPRLTWLHARLRPVEQGVLLHEEFWP